MDEKNDGISQLDGLIDLLKLAYAERNIKKEVSENSVEFTFSFNKSAHNLNPVHNLNNGDANIFAIAQEHQV